MATAEVEGVNSALLDNSVIAGEISPAMYKFLSSRRLPFNRFKEILNKAKEFKQMINHHMLCGWLPPPSRLEWIDGKQFIVYKKYVSFKPKTMGEFRLGDPRLVIDSLIPIKVEYVPSGLYNMEMTRIANESSREIPNAKLRSLFRAFNLLRPQDEVIVHPIYPKVWDHWERDADGKWYDLRKNEDKRSRNEYGEEEEDEL